MRGGVCSIQLQALTPEAVTVVKQAVNIATRRGHAQVTPLHVASAMLANSTGLFKKACIQCHSHPLQCKALELCFNVALNRLPVSTSSPLLGPHYSSPSLSNALVAAFKRAQAHQRRGTIESQQQQHTSLALKIEVEQLIISILDDPSVSRVMREPGFSSTLVKSKVEHSISVEVCSQKPLSKDINTSTKPQVLGGSNSTSYVSSSRPFGQVEGSFIKPIDYVNNDDVTSVLSEFVKRRRNIVIVGESLTNAEGVARGVMGRFEVENVPRDLKYVQFVSLPIMYFRNISKEEVEQKFEEVKSLVKSYVGRGVILYLGDLKWLFEFWSSYCQQRTKYYCSVEHMVMELRKLVSGSVENSRLWLMGISTFKTYMKCKICSPSLESLLELHPFTIPVANLSLSLNLDSDFQDQERSKVIFKDVTFEDIAGTKKHLTCCRDCSLNFEKEAKNIASTSKKLRIADLPSWLQNCKQERSHIMEYQQENERLEDICKKWNSFCNSVHRNHSIIEKPVLFASSCPSSPTSVSSHERKFNLHHSHLNWPIISEPRKSLKECELHTETGADDCHDSNFIMFMPETNVPKPDLLSNPNSSPNSASSSEALDGLDNTQMFKELSADNLKILCDALEQKVPQHREMIPEIASTVLCCRSGMKKVENHLMRREHRQETWLLFLGAHSQPKENISKELAKVVFGSYNNFVTIGMSNFSDSTEDDSDKRKRPRDELGSTYLQKFGEAANENPHRVFFMEDLDQVDYFSQKGVQKAIQSGSITLPGGESVPLNDAIVIFSCESISSLLRSPPRKLPHAENKGKENIDDNLEEKIPSLSLDLNIAIEDDTRGVALGGGNGILELVDKQFNFNMQKL
ncbi:PREDICTED: protein SMAX1-LIKE 3-like isoform X1 [Lupinus angustifolius]|uniref:protein SMAX1-LIKE 3-like isoform X1 n=1 Tax=Lupinus angustifolius TaxID=3871 RepID=UPI00092EBF45|nr:PREDICTED: protein SMAX1-LIKE 3-like isoform X1 [Lupinus angustifolius]